MVHNKYKLWASLSDDEKSETILAYKNGTKLADLSRKMGVSTSSIKRYADPEWWQGQLRRQRELRAARSQGIELSTRPIARHTVLHGRLSVEAAFQRLAQDIPEDTRTITGTLMGDPLPGRSALEGSDT